jgi:hypothetical protein
MEDHVVCVKRVGCAGGKCQMARCDGEVLESRVMAVCNEDEMEEEVMVLRGGEMREKSARWRVYSFFAAYGTW